MSAVICLPINSGGLPYARIYRADSQAGSYTAYNVIEATQLEYEDINGDCSKYYQVSFSTNSTGTDPTETTKVSVKTLNRKVIDVIRIELQIPVTKISDSDIDYLLDNAKQELMLDICTYYNSVQITKLTEDTMYQLPGVFFFDKNFGGVISILDFEFYKQTTPTYLYTEKVPVVPVKIDPEERYVELAEPLSSNEVLKVNFYAMTRRILHSVLVQLLAYKLCFVFYETISINNLAGSASKIKIGDISIQTGTSTVTSSYIYDVSTKMNAKYTKLLDKVRTGFYRTQ